MMTFLFWNVQRKPLDGYVTRLAQQHRADVVLLIEHAKPDETLLQLLQGIAAYTRVPSPDRFGVFVRFDGRHITRIDSPVPNERICLWHVKLPASNPLLLVLVHGLDIINNREIAKRELFFERLRNDISYIESRLGHKNTVIVGDFNANPFDASIGSARGLHAIRVREVGGKRTRSVLNQEYEFFCNPMWSCYKGWDKSPAGTYYFNGSDVHEVFWHMVDQVVLRPQALHMFSERHLRVLTEAGNVSLLTTNGLPDARNASDHLPVFFKLNLKAKAEHD